MRCIAWCFAVLRARLSGGRAVESRFQEHVLRLKRDGKLSPALVELMLPLLRTKLRARGLWRRPPAFIGYTELDVWSDEMDLQILGVDAIEFAILKRLDALSARIELGDNVDGFIALNVDRFLGERQRRADPIGYAIYHAVRGALGDRLSDAEPRSSRESIEDALRAYPGRSSLLGAVARVSDAVDTQLRDLLAFLSSRGLRADLGDLVELLRPEARRWNRALHEGAGGEEDAWRVMRVLGSRQLLDRLERAIESSGGQSRRRKDLARVFREWRDSFARGEDLSQAELAERLEMPRATLSDHVRSLRELIASLDPSEPPSGRLSSPQEPPR
jgi:hypothetical protein